MKFYNENLVCDFLLSFRIYFDRRHVCSPPQWCSADLIADVPSVSCSFFFWEEKKKVEAAGFRRVLLTFSFVLSAAGYVETLMV